MTLSIFDLNLPDPDDVDNIIFVRIPKTGSGAVSTLCPHLSWMKRAAGLGHQVIKYPPWNNSDALKHYDHSVWKHWKTARTFSFTVVRNPFDYLASKFYHGLRQAQRYRSLRLKYINDKELFEQYIRFYCSDQTEREIRDDYHYHDLKHYIRAVASLKGTWNVVFKNQYVTRSLFYQAFDESGKCQVDVILRYEKLNEGINEIFCKYFKNSPTITLPYVRVEEKNKDYKNLYTGEMIKLVEEHYKDDLEIFGYNFNGSIDDEMFIDPETVSIFPYGKLRFQDARPRPVKIRSIRGIQLRGRRHRVVKTRSKQSVKDKKQIPGVNSPIPKKVKKHTSSHKPKRATRKVNGAKQRSKKTARYRIVNGRKIKV